MRKYHILLTVLVLVLLPAMVMAAEKHPIGNLGGGSLTVTGTGSWAQAYHLIDTHRDFTASSGPVAIGAFFDVTGCAVPDPPGSGDWSHYYAKMSVWDWNNSRRFDVVWATEWLGGYHGVSPQPWDRIRQENNVGLAMPEAWYCTEGGTTDNPIPGTSPTEYYEVYPTEDRDYFTQLVIDPDNSTFTTEIYDRGNGGDAWGSPTNQGPDGKPNNFAPDNYWYTLNSVTDTSFDFSDCQIWLELWASTQSPEGETQTFSWWDASLGEPFSQQDTPVPTPELPASALLLLGACPLGLLYLRGRRG